MEPLRLEPLTDVLAATVAGWFRSDAEARARFDMYDEHPRWWSLVESDVHRHGYIAMEGYEPVGFVDVELDGARASFALMVRANRRNEGLGPRLIALARDEARRLGAGSLLGYVEPDNPAAIRCCLTAGLALGEVGADGLIPAVADLHPAKS